MSRTPTEVLQDHLAKRLANDIEGDIAANFSPDVILLSSFGTFRGHEGVRESSAVLSRRLGEDASFTYNKTIVEHSYAFLEWSASAKKVVIEDGADSFVIQDGKIVMQTVHYTIQRRK